MRCQIYGHTKYYFRNSPRCVKCAEQQLMSECSRKVQDDAVKCVNCGDQPPANYRGCLVHKKLQQQLHPKLRDTYMPQTPPQQGHANQSRQQPHTPRQLSNNPILNIPPHPTHTQHPTPNIHTNTPNDNDAPSL